MLATTNEMLATIQNMNNMYNMDWAPQNFYQISQSVYSGWQEPLFSRDIRVIRSETASRSRPLEVRALLPQRHAISNTSSAARRPVELFPIRCDHRIDHLATHQALPAGEAE